jgi:hypothetical protein
VGERAWVVGAGGLARLEWGDPDESEVVGKEAVRGPAPIVGCEIEAPATAAEQQVEDRSPG